MLNEGMPVGLFCFSTAWQDATVAVTTEHSYTLPTGFL